MFVNEVMKCVNETMKCLSTKGLETLRAGFGGCSLFPVSSGDMSSTIDLLFAKKKKPDSDEQATPIPTASEDPSEAQYSV